MKRLLSVVAALNEEVTRLKEKKPKDAIKAKSVAQKPSSTVPGRPVGLHGRKLPSEVGIRYLYQPGELEGGGRRATDPVWSLGVCHVGRAVTKPDEPVLCYLEHTSVPPRGALCARSSFLCLPTPSRPWMGSSGAEDCVLKWFGMDAIGQHPSLVIICAQTKFLLVLGFHRVAL